MKQSFEVEFDCFRCPAHGRYYYREKGHGSGCADCHEKTIANLREIVRQQSATIERWERVSRSLRGVITRLRKAKR